MGFYCVLFCFPNLYSCLSVFLSVFPSVGSVTVVGDNENFYDLTQIISLYSSRLGG